MEELKGTARQDIRSKISTAKQTYIGVVQARPESSGAVEAHGGDAGGQIFMFSMNPKKWHYNNNSERRDNAPLFFAFASTAMWF